MVKNGACPFDLWSSLLGVTVNVGREAPVTEQFLIFVLVYLPDPFLAFQTTLFLSIVVGQGTRFQSLVNFASGVASPVYQIQQEEDTPPPPLEQICLDLPFALL